MFQVWRYTADLGEIGEFGFIGVGILVDRLNGFFIDG
jgi:hypothetical protein